MASHQVVIERTETPVMFKRVADEVTAIRRGMQEFEQAVGLRVRKYYGVFDNDGEYRICVQLRDSDDPQALGLEVGSLPGGRYVRERLTGEPPKIYELIGPTFERLSSRRDRDPSRPGIEFYRRRAVIDLLLPSSESHVVPPTGYAVGRDSVLSLDAYEPEPQGLCEGAIRFRLWRLRSGGLPRVTPPAPARRRYLGEAARALWPFEDRNRPARSLPRAFGQSVITVLPLAVRACAELRAAGTSSRVIRVIGGATMRPSATASATRSKSSLDGCKAKSMPV